MLMFLNIFTTGRRLQKDDSGVTAIEFAFIAPVFFTLLFGIFEMGYTFLKINMLQNAVAVVSKDIYTGAASGGTVTYEDIEEGICSRIYFTGNNCQAKLVVELTEVDSFTDLPDTDAICNDENVDIEPAVNYEPGGSTSIVFMRACFMTNVLMPGLAFGLHLDKNEENEYALISTTAFVNEPF